jgi:hypothetical protein
VIQLDVYDGIVPSVTAERTRLREVQMGFSKYQECYACGETSKTRITRLSYFDRGVRLSEMTH